MLKPCDEAHTKTEAVPALGHTYGNECDGDCNLCGAGRTPAMHKDTDGNHLCDECGASLPKEGLSVGATVGIVISAVTVGGIGIFALIWFVIKKKKISDLVGFFKK